MGAGEAARELKRPPVRGLEGDSDLEHAPRVRVGCPESMVAMLLPAVIRRLSARHCGVPFEVLRTIPITRDSRAARAQSRADEPWRANVHPRRSYAIRLLGEMSFTRQIPAVARLWAPSVPGDCTGRVIAGGKNLTQTVLSLSTEELDRVQHIEGVIRASDRPIAPTVHACEARRRSLRYADRSVRTRNERDGSDRRPLPGKGGDSRKRVRYRCRTRRIPVALLHGGSLPGSAPSAGRPGSIPDAPSL